MSVHLWLKHLGAYELHLPNFLHLPILFPFRCSQIHWKGSGETKVSRCKWYRLPSHNLQFCVQSAVVLHSKSWNKSPGRPVSGLIIYHCISISLTMVTWIYNLCIQPSCMRSFVVRLAWRSGFSYSSYSSYSAYSLYSSNSGSVSIVIYVISKAYFAHVWAPDAGFVFRRWKNWIFFELGDFAQLCFSSWFPWQYWPPLSGARFVQSRDLLFSPTFSSHTQVLHLVHQSKKVHHYEAKDDHTAWPCSVVQYSYHIPKIPNHSTFHPLISLIQENF